MTMQSAQIALAAGAAAVPLNTAEAGGQGSDRGTRLTVRNTAAVNVVHVGGPGVTAATGYELGPGQVLVNLALGPADVLFAFSAVGATVHVLRAGVGASN